MKAAPDMQRPQRVTPIPTQVLQAEDFALRQRRAGLQFLKMSAELAANPADIAMCERVVAAARTDPGEFENLITFPEVNALFCRRALYFDRSR